MKYIITSLLAISIIFANVNSAYAFSFKKNTTETTTEKVKLTKEEKQALKAAKAEEKKQIKEQIKQEKQQAKEEKKAQKEQLKIEKQQAKEEQKLIKQQQKELKKAAKKQNKETVEQTDEISQTEELQSTENQTQDIITDKKTAKQQAKALKKEQKEQAKALKKEQKEKAKAEKKALKEAERQAQLKANAKGVKKRSALAIFLNPNLDIYEVRASHILVKKRKDAVAIRNDIIKGEITFEEAAQRYSLCPSGLNGGDLGYFHRKKMEQLFADTAFDLKIGEISQPVGTKFGWHIIKTTDKR